MATILLIQREIIRRGYWLQVWTSPLTLPAFPQREFLTAVIFIWVHWRPWKSPDATLLEVRYIAMSFFCGFRVGHGDNKGPLCCGVKTRRKPSTDLFSQGREESEVTMLKDICRFRSCLVHCVICFSEAKTAPSLFFVRRLCLNGGSWRRVFEWAGWRARVGFHEGCLWVTGVFSFLSA